MELKPFSVQTLNHSPELKSSFISRLLFSWFDKTVWNGRTKTIDFSDLWDLNPDDRLANNINFKFVVTNRLLNEKHFLGI